MSKNKTTSKYSETYISFSGCDMVASINILLPNSEGKSVKVSRVIGELQTLTYSIHMDKVPVRSIGSVNAKDYLMGPRTIAGSLIFAMFNQHFAQEILSTANAANGVTGQQILMDELPPFDITVSMVNEYGAKARLALYGVRIINEGNVMSINDVYTENTYQFVATDIEYLSDATGKSSSGTSLAQTYAESRITGLRNSTTPVPVPSSNNRMSNSEEVVKAQIVDGNLNITG